MGHSLNGIFSVDFHYFSRDTLGLIKQAVRFLYIYIYFLLFSIGSLSFGYDTRVDSFRCGSHEFMRDARSTECKSMAKAVKTVPGLRKRLSYTRDYQPELQERQKRKRERKKSIITGYHGCCMASSVFFDLQ